MHGLAGILHKIPPKARLWVIGAPVGGVIGLFLLKHNSSSSGSGSSTLTANGVAIPAGGPALVHTQWITKFLTKTKVVRIHVPTTRRGKGWGHWNFVQGEIHQLRGAMRWERKWLNWYRKRPHVNASRIRQLETRLNFQNGELGSLRRQSQRAYKQAKG